MIGIEKRERDLNLLIINLLEKGSEMRIFWSKRIYFS